MSVPFRKGIMHYSDSLIKVNVPGEVHLYTNLFG